MDPDRRARTVLHGRAAPRRDRAAARRPACGGGRRGDAHPGRAAAGHADVAGPPPTSPACAAVAQPHCHQHAVMGWDADAALLRRRRRASRRRRRLLRAGRQLRRRTRPLRRVGRRRRDGAAAGRPRGAARRAWCSPTASPAAPSSSSSAGDERPPGRAAGRPPAAQASSTTGRADAQSRTRPDERSAPMTGFVPPPYPYERLDEVIAIAAEHDGGAVDLSIGTPVRSAARRGDRGARQRRDGPWLPALDRHAGLPRRPPPVDRAAARRDRRPGEPSSRLASVRRSSSRLSRTTSSCVTRRATPSSTRRSATRRTRWARPSPAAGRCPTSTLDEIADADAERALCVWVNSPAQPDRRAARPRRGGGLGRERAACRCSPTSATPSSRWDEPADDDPCARHGRRPGGALAVQAGQLRRRPNRLLRRRCRAGALPARGAQARRADAARAGAGRGRPRARRRRPRRGAA